MKNPPGYFVVGGVAAAFDLVFFLLFCTWLGFNYLLVGVLGFILATLVNYALSIRWVFESGRRFGRRSEIAAVYLVSLIGLGLHSIVLLVAVSRIGMDKLFGKLVATGLVFIWNYGARHYYVFGVRR